MFYFTEAAGWIAMTRGILNKNMLHCTTKCATFVFYKIDGSYDQFGLRPSRLHSGCLCVRCTRVLKAMHTMGKRLEEWCASLLFTPHTRFTVHTLLLYHMTVRILQDAESHLTASQPIGCPLRKCLFYIDPYRSSCIAHDQLRHICMFCPPFTTNCIFNILKWQSWIYYEAHTCNHTYIHSTKTTRTVI